MSTILSDAQREPFKSWPGTFNLYQNPDGSFLAELSTELSRLEWGLRWKLDVAERQLASALMLLSQYSKEFPDNFLVLIGGRLHELLGSDLIILSSADTSMESRVKARKNITKMINEALDALEKRSLRKSHGSAITLEMDGVEKPLAWVVMEYARRLVEATQELPTKGQIKHSVIAAFSTNLRVSSAQWAKAFKEAGLANLQRSDEW